MRCVGSARMRRFFFALSCLALGVPGEALAQTEGLFSVGGSVTRFGSVEDSVGSSFGVGVLIRLRPRAGWGPTVGLGWYSAELFDEAEGERRLIGHVRVRPIMVGYGYTHARDRVALYGGTLAGYSPNSARISRAIAAQAETGGPAYVLNASDALILKPIASVTFSIRPRIGVIGSAAVSISDPKIR